MMSKTFEVKFDRRHGFIDVPIRSGKVAFETNAGRIEVEVDAEGRLEVRATEDRLAVLPMVGNVVCVEVRKR